MTRPLLPRVAAPTVLLLLAACGQQMPVDPSTDIPRPTVTEHTRIFTVAPRGTNAARADDHTRALEPVVEFVSALGTPTRITVSGPDAALTAMIGRALRERLGDMSVTALRSASPPSSERDATSIAVSWATVSVPGCPDWTRPGSLSSSRLHSTNFGCATAQALAAMVDRPLDLSTPTPLGPADGTREALAVDRYRTDKVKEPTSGGGFAP